MLQDQYIKRGIITKDAVYSCQHPLYRNMMAWAVPCDGHQECRDNLDEDGCSTPYDLMLLTTLFAAFVIALAHSFIHRLLFVDNTPKNGFDIEMEEKGAKAQTHDQSIQNEIYGLSHLLNQPRCIKNNFKQCHYKAFSKVHKKLSYSMILESIVDSSQLLLKKDQCQIVSKNLFQLEMNYHHGDFLLTKLCLKKTLGTHARTQKVIDDNFPTVLLRISNSKPVELIKNNKVVKLAIFCLSITLSYIDFVKDIIVLVTMSKAAVMFFNGRIFALCTSQLLLLQLVTIFIPLVLSGLYCSLTHSSGLFGILFEGTTRASAGTMRVLTFLLSPLHQGLIMLKMLLIDDSIRKMGEQSSDIQNRLNMYLADVKRLTDQKRVLAYLFHDIRILELGFEIYPQIVIQMLLIFMRTSLTATNSNFQALFDQSESRKDVLSIELFLLLSVLVSMISSSWRMLQHYKAQKAGFTLAVGMLILWFRYWMSLWTIFLTCQVHGKIHGNIIFNI